jgi:hypothetical protein
MTIIGNHCPACGDTNPTHDCPNPPKRYRKKPITVWAQKVHYPVEVATLEGIMRASPGDYLIEGIAGEIYPCKPDIFEATYEPA